MAKSKYLLPGGIVALSFVLLSIFSAQASPGSVINFEGFAPGMIVDSVSYGHGITGDPVDGEVQIFGLNPKFGPDINAAMIFDATCGGGTPSDCSGGDGDLYNPAEKNVLIISEDLDSTDPDDADLVGAQFHFDFSGFGPTGTVMVGSLDVMDVEFEEFGDAYIEVFDPEGTLIGSVLVPETGNGGIANVPVNISGVASMIVDLDGSGAITNVNLEVPAQETATPTPTATPTEPTAIKLLYFQVAGVDDQHVDLAWATESEIDNYGFILYRAASNDFSQAAAIHFEPAHGSLAGNTYAFTDAVPRSGEWWYWLSDIDTHGLETKHGSVKATVPAEYAHGEFQIFVPLLVLR